MRTLPTILTALACAALLPACGPTYYLAMRPSSGSGQWAEGAEAARQQHDSLDVRLSFVRYEASRLVFAADLRNGTGRPLTVGPGDFWYQPLATQPVASTASTALPSRLTAFDMEPTLQELQQRIEKEAAAATNVPLSEVLTSLSHTVENVAAIKKTETKQQIADRDARQQSESNYYTRQRLEAAAAAEQHRAQLDELRTHALRRTTIEPGQAVRGYVYFPRTDAADLLRLTAPGLAPGTTLDFVQTRSLQP